MRKLCILELLSVKKVRSFESVREQESWNLIESIRKTTALPVPLMGSKPTVNLTNKIFTMMNTIAIRISVGSRCKDQGELLELIEEAISLSGGFELSDLFPSVKVLHLITGMGKN